MYSRFLFPNVRLRPTCVHLTLGSMLRCSSSIWRILAILKHAHTPFGLGLVLTHELWGTSVWHLAFSNFCWCAVYLLPFTCGTGRYESSASRQSKLSNSASKQCRNGIDGQISWCVVETHKQEDKNENAGLCQTKQTETNKYKHE